MRVVRRAGNVDVVVNLTGPRPHAHSNGTNTLDLPVQISRCRSPRSLTLPPLPLRYVGRDAAEAFFRALAMTGPDRFGVLHTRANRQPALAAYRLDPEANIYNAWDIWVLTIDTDAIAQVTAFIDPLLISRFGFRSTLVHS